MRVRKGDKVVILKGRDRGKRGAVVVADHTTERVKVEGVNIYKRHQRRGGRNRQPGGIVEVVAALSAANVAMICPHCDRPTRVGYQIVGDAKRRICKRCQGIIEHVKK